MFSCILKEFFFSAHHSQYTFKTLTIQDFDFDTNGFMLLFVFMLIKGYLDINMDLDWKLGL